MATDESEDGEDEKAKGEDEGDTMTTRRSRSPFKEHGRVNSLKERALGLIRGGKRGSFRSLRGDGECLSLQPRFPQQVDVDISI
jgi:hypothetical protein